MNGVMGEIRDLAAQGKSAQELIALGYRPGSVYKAQRQLRRNEGNAEGAPANQAAAALPSAALEKSQAKLSQLEAERRRLEDTLLEADAERLELYGAEVEWENEKEELLGRVKELETQALTAEGLRRQVNELQSQVPGQQRALVESRGAMGHWRQRCAEEETARRAAENAVASVREQIQRLQGDHDRLRAAAEQLWEAYQALLAEAARLRPLEVSWAGHPCKVCQQPLSGAVDRQTAAKLLTEFAHPHCLKKPGPGWAAALAAGAAAYGLAKWGQR